MMAGMVESTATAVVAAVAAAAAGSGESDGKRWRMSGGGAVERRGWRW